jgi:hypothetical protein
MKKIKIKTEELQLMKETIASLSTGEAQRVLGGSYSTDYTYNTCASVDIACWTVGPTANPCGGLGNTYAC